MRVTGGKVSEFAISTGTGLPVLTNRKIPITMLHADIGGQTVMFELLDRPLLRWPRAESACIGKHPQATRE
jgi:hypothetical protein